MAEKTDDPLQEVKDDLNEAVTDDAENLDAEAAGDSNAEFSELSQNVDKLCKDVESWQTKTNETLSQLQERLTESQQSILRLLGELKPAPPEVPEIVAIAPAPEPKSESESADGQKVPETRSKAKRTHRFL